MAERRRHKKRIQEVSEPTKEEKAVAKYLRFNCSTKSTNMMGHRVDYFIASKAVDCLLDSKWAKSKKPDEALFTTRESVVDYCNRLLKKQFFHRALKVMKKKPEKDPKKEKEKGKSEGGKEEEKKSKKEKEKKKDTDTTDTKKEKSDESPGSPKKKKEVKKKFKLEPHEDQLFLDGNEVFVLRIHTHTHTHTYSHTGVTVLTLNTPFSSLFVQVYVWIYDPVHFKTFAMGLVLARCILFLIIWLVTGGRHHFWFLPNLTADVGFVDSFRPIYTHEYKGPKGKKGAGEKSEGKGPKTQKSDSEDKSDGEKKEDEEEEVEDEEEEEAGKEAERRSDSDGERREDDGSQHSNGNDFEMITRDELEQHTEEEEEQQQKEAEPKPQQT
ncbi:Translocation protein SEC62 [Bagarius yarrelli]|uniref:Translocation protein SEC62 n=1 Tax=Bagarius yarrelli TaxID=175774 RepID=A0A556TZR4_BAGYA|nr:Translocation protein SEC62 [Bagarius yarrelli]